MSAGQELYLQIVLDENGSVAKVTNLGQAVKSVGSESEGTSKKVDKLTDSFSKNDSAIESFIDTLKALGASYAALRIERMIEDWIKLDITQSQADQSLKSIMISTNRFSESFYQGTLKQAEALQKLTGVRDQDIERGQKMLMLYENISSDLMPRTTQAMVNLAALMEGDVRTAAFELGKAMDGETESLRRAGIIIDENVFKQRGAIGVLEEVEKKVNGQAVSLTEGAGKWKLLGTAIDEAKESIGAAFTQIAEDSGILQRTIDLVNKFTELMRSWGATPQQKIGWQIEDLKKLNSELVSAQSTLEAMKEHPLKGWLGEWLNEGSIESATQHVKSLNDEINRILTNLADTPTFLEKASKVTEDSLPPIKASTDAVRDWATVWENAKSHIQELHRGFKRVWR